MGRVWLLPQSSEAATGAIIRALLRHGLTVVRSFDLRQALSGSEDLEGGLDRSESPGVDQFVVLLTYGGGEGPVVVTVTTDANATYLRLPTEGQERPWPRLCARVQAVLWSLIFSEPEPLPDAGDGRSSADKIANPSFLGTRPG